MSEILEGEFKPLPKEGIDFDYVEIPDPTITERSTNPIVLLHGEFEGILIQYGRIQLHIEDVPPKVSFDFNILRGNQKYDRDFLGSEASFKNLLGDIIMSTLIDMAQREEAKQNESGNDDSQIISQE